MRIGMVTADYLPNIGGLAAHVFFLGRALARQGHEVVVIKPVPGEKRGITRVPDAVPVTYEVPFRAGTSGLGHIVSRTLAILDGLRKLRTEVGPFDVLHQHDHRFSTFAMRRASSEAPWVWTNHTSSFLRDYDVWYRRLLVRGAYRGVDGILTVSDELYQKSRHLWEQTAPIRFIPNGVDVGRFKPQSEDSRSRFGLADDDFVVLCPRRIAPKNGVIYMVEAARQLAEQHPEVSWKFAFLGGGATPDARKNEYADQVRAAAGASVLEDRIDFLGDIPMADMPEINASADVVVMPSLMEAVSLSALEGMATQKPVVATNVGGLPQIIHHEETGLLVPPRDPAALAGAVLRLYRDPELRVSVARAARTLAVKQYSWDAVAEQTVDFYKTIVNGNDV